MDNVDMPVMASRVNPGDTSVIDGTTYVVKKLKFGAQVELASIVATSLKGIGVNVSDTNSKETEMSIDIGMILSQSPTKFTRIIELGLGIPRSTVENFENVEEVLAALEKIMKANSVTHILGKSTALLNNISL